MKKLLTPLAAVLLLAACQNHDPKIVSPSSSDTTKYPFQIKKVHNWEMNSDSKNLVVAMTLLKTFENLDTAGMKKVLADSVWFILDGYKFKGTKPEFLKQIQGEFAKMSSFKIEIEDAESVINKDKSEEWVSLWYNQISVMKDGKADTINLFNDIKLKDGKVLGLSEYVQHPMKK